MYIFMLKVQNVYRVTGCFIKMEGLIEKQIKEEIIKDGGKSIMPNLKLCKVSSFVFYFS